MRMGLHRCARIVDVKYLWFILTIRDPRLSADVLDEVILPLDVRDGDGAEAQQTMEYDKKLGRGFRDHTSFVSTLPVT
jgi:hypothetical protein